MGLAEHCTKAEFRMHLRAHGKLSIIFTTLKDAAVDEAYCLCAVTILYLLAKDRRNVEVMPTDAIVLLGQCLGETFKKTHCQAFAKNPSDFGVEALPLRKRTVVKKRYEKFYTKVSDLFESEWRQQQEVKTVGQYQDGDDNTLLEAVKEVADPWDSRGSFFPSPSLPSATGPYLASAG